MYDQNIISNDKNQKNRIGTIVGLIFCVVLTICSIVLEVVMFRDEVLRAMGKVHGWNGNGFIMIFEVVPMLIVASIISKICRKKAIGTAKTILNYLRPIVILIGGLVVIPVIGVMVVLLSAKK